MAAVRIRKNVRTLGAPGDDLDWYSRAVAALRGLAVTDPTSWRYQAAVHGYPGHNFDPFAIVGETLPSAADQQRFWSQCQHQSWFFLPWHRGYLACFEEIVSATVSRLGGPDDWALPYWNYSDAAHATARSLPAAFLKATKPDGSLNPLWSAGRVLLTSADQVPLSDVGLSCLTKSPFATAGQGGSPGFGGPKTGLSHFGGISGELEASPHNLIHDDVDGLMKDPDTAALDPIFWLHHANIDRLWEVWTQRNPTFINPADKAWLNGTSFELHDATGVVVTFTSAQMQDTHFVRHGYEYDDVSDPFAAPAAPPVRVMAAAAPTSASVSSVAAQLIGASQTSVPLATARTTIGVTIDPAAARRSRGLMLEAGKRDIQSYLNIENITGSKLYGIYDVYVGFSGSSGRLLLAGHLSTFGLKKASDPQGPHSGSGMTSVFDITPLIEQLMQDGWDGQCLEVTLVARKPPGSIDATVIDLKVGRISIYHS